MLKTDEACAIRALQANLKAALLLPEGSSHARRIVHEAFRADSELFFQAGYRLLESIPTHPDCSKIYDGLLGFPPFLLELTRPGRFGLRKLAEICRSFAAIDTRLDIRLTKLLPGRLEDPHHLPAPVIARILDILNQISVGPRLILMISHLTTYRDALVAEKAALLVGRRIRNPGWTQRRLASGGPEVRAGVVEGMWGLDTPVARRTLRVCLLDTSERVVGHAVFGLHLLHENDVVGLVEGMAADDRPAFRATAAWLAGRIGHPDFTALLERARTDGDASVRLAAKQAMVELRQSAVKPDLPAAEPQPPPAPAVPREFPRELPPDLRRRFIPAERTAPKGSQRPQKRRPDPKLDGTSTDTRWD